MPSTAGNCRPSIVAMTSSCAVTCSASGCANTVRIAAATISLLPFRDPGEDVAHDVDPASLRRGAEQHRLDRAFEAGVRVGDDELRPAEPA
jgi:hypothetical protein